MNSQQLTALKAELTNDPLGIGYSRMADDEIAESLSKPVRQTDRESVTASDLMSALEEGEYNALPARGKAYFGLCIQAGIINLNATTRSQLGTLFPANSTTRANLVAMLKRSGSRTEELGISARVTPSDVADAKRM